MTNVRTLSQMFSYMLLPGRQGGPNMSAQSVLAQHGYRLAPGSRKDSWKIVDAKSGAIAEDNLSIQGVADFAASKFGGIPTGYAARMPG